MADLVFQNSNGNDVTTSLIVAQVFGKEHKNVVRDIENLSCSENFNRLNFERITYKDARNREQTAYEMTKDGFSFLVMGYTGTKAGEFKERFINEFNRREFLLKDDDYILMRSQQILQKRLEASEEKIKQLESQAEQRRGNYRTPTERTYTIRSESQLLRQPLAKRERSYHNSNSKRDRYVGRETE